MRRQRLMQRRKAMGYTQGSLAARLGVERSTVARWEAGECLPQPGVRRHLAAALEISMPDLEVLLGEREPPAAMADPSGAGKPTARAAPTATCRPAAMATRADHDAPEDGWSRTNRRRFTIAAALTSLGMTGPARGVLAANDPPRSIGMDHVRLAASLVDQLRLADASIGANGLCDVAIEAYRQLALWSQHATCGQSVTIALHTAMADLANQVGWLAFDADRRAECRPYLHAAISHARIVDDPRQEARALACLALLAHDDQPTESVLCAEAALRVSAGWSTPRLRTLLLMRVANAYAVQQDHAAFDRTMAMARAEFAAGAYEDDLPFLRFVTEQEVDGLQALANLSLGRFDHAVTGLRAITEVRNQAHHRNQVYYRVHLAKALQERGDQAEAATVATTTMADLPDLDSRRISKRLAEVASNFEPYRRTVPQVRAFFDTYDEASRTCSTN